MRQKTELEKSNFRYNVITTCVYLIGIIILIQLFNLQIVNGAEYRETSNTRLSRETKIEAARGSILDRTGNVLVSTDMNFSLEMYKTKVSDELLNSSILLMTNILESNGDGYIDTFPISINPFEFKFNSAEELDEWKEKYKIPETASAEEAFYLFRDKYGIQSENVKEVRQILAIRYAITTTGYSTTKSIGISNQISRESAVQLQEQGQGLTGINIVVEPVRVYHMGTLASHIIGYMGRISKDNKEELESIGDVHEYGSNDKIGQTGIEKVFEQYLRGEDGIKQVDMDVDGAVTGEYTSQEAIGGASIVLTVDANLQRIAEIALANNIEKIRSGGFSQAYDANGGAVIVTNVKTGEILAMASYPNYEPSLFYNGISNEKYAELGYNNNIAAPLTNRAIQGVYSPGSIFKMITAVAALETGVTTLTEKINDNGRYPLAGVPYQDQPACWYFNDYGRGHGPLNISNAIKHSCNYFFFEVSSRMGIDQLARYASYFGLGTKTGIELDNEKAGTLAQRSVAESKGEVWGTGQTLNASIGQGFNSFTPIQMAKYISMVANGGKKLDLSLIKSVVQSNGTQIAKSEIEEFVKNRLRLSDDTSEDLSINEENLKAVLEGMKSVTDEVGGTAYSIFKDFNIEVGGKTGSAEAGRWTNAWFAGFAPYEDPEISVVVIVENGGHGYYTAEVVREIIAEYFGMNIQNVVEDMRASSQTESFR